MIIQELVLPESLTWWAAVVVVGAGFFTAALTAAFGLGGGLALIAVMSLVFPAAAVVPVHGVAQLGANCSRVVLQRRSIAWPVVFWFCLGGVAGAALGGRLAITLPAPVLQGAIGLFVLYTVWFPGPRFFRPGAKTWLVAGTGSTVLTMFVGATGPLVAAVLATGRFDRLRLVATHAGCMVAQHAFKTIAFGFLGFAFGDWGVVIAGILVAGFFGTWVGTNLLRAMPEQKFRIGFRITLTLIALYLLAVTGGAVI